MTRRLDPAKRGKARRLGGALVLVLTVLLSACGQQAIQSRASGQVTTITLRYLATGHDKMAPLVQRFEKANPSIKVQVQYVPVEQYGQSLITALQAGNAPDVFYTNGGTGQSLSVLPLGKSGYLANLSKRSWAGSIPKLARSLYRSGNRLYGVPMALGLGGVIYNVDLFKRLGATVPTTFGEFLSLCTKIEGAGMIPVALAGQSPAFYGLLPAADLVYSADPIWDAERAAGKVTFSGSNGWRESLQEFLEMKGAGCYEPGAAAVTVAQAVNLIASGRAAMYLGPSAAAGSIKSINPKIDVRMFPLPGPTAASTRAMAGYVDSFSVNVRSSHLAAAMKFIDFLADPAQSITYARLSGNISLPDAANGTAPTEFSAFGPYLRAGKVAPIPYLEWPNAVIESNLTQGLQGLLTGQRTVDDVLRMMDTAWNQGTGS